MPFKTTTMYVAPQVLVKVDDQTVYYTYKDDNADTPYDYWYSFSDDLADNDDFYVFDLPGYVPSDDTCRDYHATLIKRLIQSGYFNQAKA